MRRLGLVWCVLLVLVGAPSQADAYSGITHRWLMRMAIERLVAEYPGRYDELLDHLEHIVDGAEREDDTYDDGDSSPLSFRQLRHFYRPTDEAGLDFTGVVYENSYEWGVVPSEDNKWGWDDAMEAYRTGDLDEAYFAIGHVLHLLQDTTIPAHTHLDSHGPTAPDDYESYCKRLSEEYGAVLPVPPEDAEIPTFSDPHEAWQRTASASYWRNMYPGDLSDTERASGIILEMFPNLSWSWLFERWSIDAPAVGALGTGFFEEQPGWFYFKRTAYAATLDVAAYDPLRAEAIAYGASGGAPMVELLARDLTPVAILNTTGLLKLFLDDAYSQDLDWDDKENLEEPAVGCNLGRRSGGTWFSIAVALLCLVLGKGRGSTRSLGWQHLHRQPQSPDTEAATRRSRASAGDVGGAGPTFARATESRRDQCER